MLDEAREASKHSRKLGRVMGNVAAHRLKKMREFLAYQALATWRRMNGFDRIAADDNLWASRQLSLTPEQITQNLWSEVNALKAAISMLVEDTMTRPWQKTIDFVDGLKGKLPEEELAVIKEYVEKRSREAAQVQVTVTQVNTVQHSLAPIRLIPNHHQMDVLIWRTPRVRWIRSWRSANHHQLVRVSKRPDSSVPRTRGYGSKDKPPPTVS